MNHFETKTLESKYSETDNTPRPFEDICTELERIQTHRFIENVNHKLSHTVRAPIASALGLLQILEHCKSNDEREIVIKYLKAKIELSDECLKVLVIDNCYILNLLNSKR